MEKEMQDKLIKIIEDLSAGVDSTSGVLYKEMSLLMSEYLRISFLNNLTWFALFLLVALGLGFMARLLIKSGELEHIKGGFCAIFLSLLCLSACAYCTMNMVKIQIAPRVVALEKVASLIKGDNK